MGFELSLRIFFSFKNIYFFSSPPFIAILIASLTCRILRKKYYLDIRDLYPEVFFALGLIGSNSVPGRILKFLTNTMYRGAKKIYCTTSLHKQEILKGTNSPVELIYNGYDHEVFSNQKVSQKSMHDFTLIFHGNLGKFQNIELLIELAKRLQIADKEIRNIVIGTGAKETLLQNHGLKNLTYLGFVPFRDLPQYLESAHVGLSLRTDEEISRTSFPVKVFEFLGMNLPVIHTPAGEAGRFVEGHAIGKAFSPNQIDQIIDFILNLKKDRLMYDFYYNNCESVKHKFQRQNLVRSFELN